jgi:nucleoside-diphosphate-sugar epimerase
MKVVLTGGTGFIGKPALEQLLRGGHEVLSLSRQISFPEAYVGNSRLIWHPCDLAQPETWMHAARDFAPEGCLHLAWEGIPDYGLDQSLRNLTMGSKLVEGLIQSGCRHFVISGSCWEYGKVSGAIREDNNSVEPGVFAASKNALRGITEALCRSVGVSLAWGRVFYPYGPAQKSVSLLPTVCRGIAEGQPPALRTPSAANDFLYVDDTAEALVLLLEKKAHGIYNIGSGKPEAVGNMADMLLRFAGKAPVFNLTEASPENGFWADISKLNALGWQPRTSLEEGLQRTHDFFLPKGIH